MRRAPPVAVLAVLASCSGGQGTGEGGPQDPIACAVGGQVELTGVCMVARVRKPEGLFLDVRHPDGRARRFRVTSDGTGLVADGAGEVATVFLVGHTLDVRVGGDRYIFPASRKDDSAPGDAPHHTPQ